MVFDHYNKIDETWEKVRNAIAKNILRNCSAKCSTMKYDPTKQGPGPSTTAVICVYTERDTRNMIGFKLIEIVKRDIAYKTEESTKCGRFTHAGTSVKSQKIYWNDGEPSQWLNGKPKYSTSLLTPDIWHLNVVEVPHSSPKNGYWILQLENVELTELWHHLSDIIKSRKNPGIIQMICPYKEDRKSPTEKPVFEVYTSDKDKHSVGKMLVNLVKRDILYCNYNGHPASTLPYKKGIPITTGGSPQFM